MRRLATLALLVLAAVVVCPRPAVAQYVRVYGFCEFGGQSVTIQGLTQSSPPALQASYPGCTVTVYDTGTSNKTTLYASSGGGTLSNPFMASSTTGYWYFYVPTSADVDITISGAGIVTPFTFGDVKPGGGGGGGSGTVDPGTQYFLSGYVGTGTQSLVGPLGLSTDPTLDNLNVPGNLAATGNETVGGNETVTGNGYIGGPVPWIDLQAPPYYARPLNATANPNTTGSGSSTTLTVASNTGWKVNDGIVVSTGGAAPTMSTPSVPTVTALGVSGSSTYSYECAGIDSLEGQTAESPAGSTTTGSAVFGNQYVLISSISRSSNTVSATTSTALPYSSGNYHVIMLNVTWPSGVHDGIEYVTITGNNTFTYSQTGANETGTVTSGYTAVRLFNGFIITSATRTGSQIVFTTDVTHNIVAGQTVNGILYPTVIAVNGITPVDMDGLFTVASVTSNTITVNTGQSYGSQTETGSLNYGSTQSGGGVVWNQMGLYVWESNIVTCPALSSPTQKYYIYAEYPWTSSYALIGSTPNGSNVYRDRGAFLTGTFTPPPAASVPATASGSAQNEEYVGTVTGISGTTFTISPALSNSVSGVGVYHDASLAVTAADNAACNADGGAVYFSGPANLNYSSSEAQSYVINAPFNLFTVTQCKNLRWKGGAPLTINDTITDNIYGNFLPENFSSGTGAASATQDVYWAMSGTANPLFNAAYISNGFPGGSSIYMNHVSLSVGNGDLGVLGNGEYSRFENVYFNAPNTAEALSLAGGFTYTIHNTVLGGFPSFTFFTNNGQAIPDGQPIFGPLVPVVEVNNAALLMDGSNSGQGKGIEFDTNNSNIESFGSSVSNIYTQQAPFTPIVWIYGNAGISNISMSNDIQDSHSMPVFGEFGGVLSSLTLNNQCTFGGTLVTGDAIRALTINNECQGTSNSIGQNINMRRSNAPQSVNAGPYGTQIDGEEQLKRPLMFPFLNNYPIFWEQQTSSVTATTSGSGTIAAGSHTFCVLPVGWNGGDGGFGLTSCATVSVNGSQGVQVNATPTPGVHGYDVYADGFRTNSAIVASLPVTYSSITNYGSEPTNPGSGCPLIDQNGLDCTSLVRTNTIVPLTLYSAAGTPVPTCNAAEQGVDLKVSDATSPTYMATYTSGGAITADVICSYNGSSYSWLTH